LGFIGQLVSKISIYLRINFDENGKWYCFRE
jgi:hypothetical protein